MTFKSQLFCITTEHVCECILFAVNYNSYVVYINFKIIFPFNAELKVNEAFLFLEEHKFKSSEWCTLARVLNVPFEEIRKLKASCKETKNHDWVLEETLDYWITHHPNQPSLEKLTRAVERCDTIRSTQGITRNNYCFYFVVLGIIVLLIAIVLVYLK